MRRLLAIVVLCCVGGGLIAACGGDDDQAVAGASGAFTQGREVYRDSCAVCHGNDGEGGVGSALTEVTMTFPDCDEHVRWITIGSSKWRDEVGPTYGSQGREIVGSMPAFDGVRTEAEIRLAAAYQRVAFSGESEAAAATACGIPG